MERQVNNNTIDLMLKTYIIHASGNAATDM